MTVDIKMTLRGRGRDDVLPDVIEALREMFA